MDKKYSIEIFEKKGNNLIKVISLPNNINYRIIFDKWNKKNILDMIKINKKYKVQLESRTKTNIPINRYDCFFSESR